MVPVMAAVNEAGRNLARRDVKGHFCDSVGAAAGAAALASAVVEGDGDDEDDDDMPVCCACLCCEHGLSRQQVLANSHNSTAQLLVRGNPPILPCTHTHHPTQPSTRTHTPHIGMAH